MSKTDEQNGPTQRESGQSDGQQSAASPSRSVSRSAFKVMTGGLLSLLAGFASQAVIAWFFGAGAEMDAFLTALVIPAYLQAVLLAGLPFVFIPAFVQAETAGSEEDAWALAGTFFWLTGGILVAVAILGSLFAEDIIALTAPGLSPEKTDLAADMLAVLMFAVPMSGLGSLTTGIQNARSSFFWPALAAAVGSLTNLTLVAVLFRPLGALALAWGYLGAEALRASVTIVPVLRHGWDRLMPVRDSRVREMARLMAPFIFFGLVTRSTIVFERFFASGLPDGDLSYLGYAQKISRIAEALLGSAIVTAIFPMLARTYSREGPEALVVQAEYGFRLTLAVALPALAIMSGLAVPLVTALFERGAFVHTDTMSVSRIIPLVIAGFVVCQMVGNLITRVFYVTKDTHTAPIVAAVTSVLYIFLAKALADAQGYVGLALAQPVYRGLAIVVLGLLLVRKLRFFHLGGLLKDGLLYGAASIVAFLCAWLTTRVLVDLPALLQLVVGGLLAGAVYMVLLYQVDRGIAESVLDMVGARILGRQSGLLRFLKGQTAKGAHEAQK